MSIFAKLIELEKKEQVLLTLNYNDEDIYEVEIRIDLEGVTASMKLEFDEEEKAINMLEKYTNESAIKYRNEMVKMLT